MSENLIEQYEKNLYNTRQALIKNKLQMTELVFDGDFEKYDEQMSNLQNIRHSLNYFINNLEYSIKWMKTGVSPDGKGI